MAHTLDFSPLTEPVTQAEVDAWRDRQDVANTTWTRGDLQPFQRFGVVIGFVLVVVPVGTIIAITLLHDGIVNGAPISIGFAVVTAIGIVAVLISLVRQARTHKRSQWEIWMRTDRFARANQMTFSRSDPKPGYPGTLFQLGSNRAANDHLSSTGTRFFDLGNYVYLNGEGKDTTNEEWGYLAFTLDRKLPNMVLDSKANNRRFFGSNLPFLLEKNQVLHLEGDFDESFTLYCPKEYEPDALYIFTPDLMALLIDEAEPFDVEIVDDWMFVYSSKKFTTGDPALYARLFRIMDTVGAKALSQTDRYVDERIGVFAANAVAGRGARLQRGPSVALIFTMVGLFIALYVGFGIFLGVLGGSGGLGGAPH